MTHIPPCKWAQRKDRVLLTVELFDAKDVEIKFEIQKVFFKGNGNSSVTAGEFNHTLNLLKEISPEASNYKVLPREIQVCLIKKDKGFWDRLTQEPVKTTKNWLACDWSRWKEEDDEEDKPNFGNLGDYGNLDDMDMGGMGGGPGGDSDDEEPPNLDDLDDKGLAKAPEPTKAESPKAESPKAESPKAEDVKADAAPEKN